MARIFVFKILLVLKAWPELELFLEPLFDFSFSTQNPLLHSLHAHRLLFVLLAFNSFCSLTREMSKADWVKGSREWRGPGQTREHMPHPKAAASAVVSSH